MSMKISGLERRAREGNERGVEDAIGWENLRQPEAEGRVRWARRDSSGSNGVAGGRTGTLWEDEKELIYTELASIPGRGPCKLEYRPLPATAAQGSKPSPTSIGTRAPTRLDVSPPPPTLSTLAARTVGDHPCGGGPTVNLQRQLSPHRQNFLGSLP